MKKLLAITLALLLLLGLAACTPKGEYADERAFVEGYLELVREKGIGTEAFAEYETYHAPGTLTEEDREANALLMELKEQPEEIYNVMVSEAYDGLLRHVEYQYMLTEEYNDGTLRLCYDFQVPYSPEIEEKMSNHPAADDPDFPLSGAEAEAVKEDVARYVEEANRVHLVLAFDVAEVDGDLKFTSENISEYVINLVGHYTYQIDYEAIVAGEVKDTAPPIVELMFKTEGDRPISEYKAEAGVAVREEPDVTELDEPDEPEEPDEPDEPDEPEEPEDPEPAADVPEGPVAEAKEAFEAYVDLLKDVDIAAIAEVSGEDPSDIEMIFDMAPVMRPLFETIYGSLELTYLGGEAVSDTEVNLQYRMRVLDMDQFDLYMDQIPDEEFMTYVPEEGELENWIAENLTEDDYREAETTIPMTWDGEQWIVGDFDMPAED